MNNFQYITKNIDNFIKFLIKNIGKDENYWRKFLEVEYDKDNRSIELF